MVGRGPRVPIQGTRSPVAVTRAKVRSPGRPRSIACHDAVLRATADLLDEVRYSEVTMEAIAKRANVAKQTIYKWWPSRPRLVMEAYRERIGVAIRITDSGHIDRDLERLMIETTTALREASQNGRTGLGAVFAGLIADAQGDVELLDEFRKSYFDVRRARVAELLGSAVRRGELPAHTDIETALDLLYGPIWLRLLVRHAPLDAKLAKSVVASVLGGLRRVPGSRVAVAKRAPPKAKRAK
jgi:AcrR family transcriptional regulator